MDPKITEQTLSIPPYLSTSWDQVVDIESEPTQNNTFKLTISLKKGKTTIIDGVEAGVLEQVFACHQKFLEKRTPTSKHTPPPTQNHPQNFMGLNPEQMAAFQMRLGPSGPGGIAGGLEGMEATLQHNPAQASLPDLPQEMVEKIASIAKIITNGDLGSFPKPEPHCNCMHCQVARAIHNLPATHKESEPEPVTEEDLRFRDWEIVKTGDNLYNVTNPLDKDEHYSVFLGTPLGCTCGKKNCEHIRAVLLS